MSTTTYDAALGKVVTETADRVRESIDVQICSGLPWVRITDTSGVHDEIFIQGDEAGNFIDEAKDLYSKVGTISMETALLCVAAPYAENLFG